MLCLKLIILNPKTEASVFFPQKKSIRFAEDSATRTDGSSLRIVSDEDLGTGTSSSSSNNKKRRNRISTRVSKRIEHLSEAAYFKLFGEKYNKKECTFVLVGGSIIAFNSGFVNGSFVSGRLTPTGANQSVAGFTSSFTKSAMALVDGDLDSFGYHTCLILMRYILMFGVWGFDLGRD
jgi:hypothetical protein